MRYARFNETPRTFGAAARRRQQTVNYAATLLKTQIHQAATAYAVGELSEEEFLAVCETHMATFVRMVTQPAVVEGVVSDGRPAE